MRSFARPTVPPSAAMGLAIADNWTAATARCDDGSSSGCAIGVTTTAAAPALRHRQPSGSGAETFIFGIPSEVTLTVRRSSYLRKTLTVSDATLFAERVLLLPGENRNVGPGGESLSAADTPRQGVVTESQMRVHQGSATGEPGSEFPQPLNPPAIPEGTPRCLRIRITATPHRPRRRGSPPLRAQGRVTPRWQQPAWPRRDRPA